MPQRGNEPTEAETIPTRGREHEMPHTDPSPDHGTPAASSSSSSHLAVTVKRTASELGFDAVGICDLAPIERDALCDWLERGYAGTMRYMHRQAPQRQAPARITPRSIRAVVVLKSYYARTPAVAQGAARVARYAWG